MAGAAPRTEVRRLSRGTRIARVALIGVSIAFLGLLLAAPLGAVLAQALAKGWQVYLESFADPDTRAAIRLTLLTAAIVVPINTVFGICASWAIAKFEFKGKSLLITLIDLPFAVSPVIAGLVFVLLFGAQGWFGPWLQERDVQVIFAVPGIVLATLFISFPYVARELIPLMQQQGSDEEEAAITLGASAWITFLRVTLPKIRWGLLYGVILCNARAMGEFGAVSVVSGTHPRAHDDHAAARRDPLQRVQFRRCIRGRLAARAAGDPDAGPQVARRVARRPGWCLNPC